MTARNPFPDATQAAYCARQQNVHCMREHIMYQPTAVESSARRHSSTAVRHAEEVERVVCNAPVQVQGTAPRAGRSSRCHARERRRRWGGQGAKRRRQHDRCQNRRCGSTRGSHPRASFVWCPARLAYVSFLRTARATVPSRARLYFSMWPQGQHRRNFREAPLTHLISPPLSADTPSLARAYQGGAAASSQRRVSVCPESGMPRSCNRQRDTWSGSPRELLFPGPDSQGNLLAYMESNVWRVLRCSGARSRKCCRGVVLSLPKRLASVTDAPGLRRYKRGVSSR